MGYKEISIKLPTDFSPDQLRQEIAKTLHLKEFAFQIDTQSLDARKKESIHWLVNVGVTSSELRTSPAPLTPPLQVPYKKRDKKVVVVGSGPAGFFSALVLQKAGYAVTLIERGKDVEERASSIQTFEKGGAFDPSGNYAFGEGGAGTFSDGKLTSRSKRISSERDFILSSYINSGAPKEIAYLAHPHLGSDNLRIIVRKLRKVFQDMGGAILFETMLENLIIKNGKVVQAIARSGNLEADIFILAPGHSAYETYRMLIKNGVGFRTKNFAVGSRVEHPQTLINQSRWGQASLPGVKAAEYRLTANIAGHLPVFTFCMCPGGTVVPATAYKIMSVVNGMSQHLRDGAYANAGCVAAVNLDTLIGKTVSPLEALDWVESLEQQFYNFSGSYKIPACSISDFINKNESSTLPVSSYPLGLVGAPLWEILPETISNALRAGLVDFNRKVNGFDTGLIMGLESKTSSPIQVLRDETLLCSGFSNLYMVGEGSGLSGGIISSAADGIRVALNIIA